MASIAYNYPSAVGTTDELPLQSAFNSNETLLKKSNVRSMKKLLKKMHFSRPGKTINKSSMSMASSGSEYKTEMTLTNSQASVDSASSSKRSLLSRALKSSQKLAFSLSRSSSRTAYSSSESEDNDVRRGYATSTASTSVSSSSSLATTPDKEKVFNLDAPVTFAPTLASTPEEEASAPTWVTSDGATSQIPIIIIQPDSASLPGPEEDESMMADDESPVLPTRRVLSNNSSVRARDLLAPPSSSSARTPSMSYEQRAASYARFFPDLAPANCDYSTDMPIIYLMFISICSYLPAETSSSLHISTWDLLDVGIKNVRRVRGDLTELQKKTKEWEALVPLLYVAWGLWVAWFTYMWGMDGGKEAARSLGAKFGLDLD